MWIQILSVVLGLVFVGTGLPKLLGIKAGLENVTRYGYSEVFARVVGIGELVGAAALGWGAVHPMGRLLGGGIAIAIMLGALHSHIVKGKEAFPRWAGAAAMLLSAAALIGATLAG